MMNNITDLLDRPIAYHRIFVALTGSVKAAILLSQAIYWQKRSRHKDGWWYKTVEEWGDETGLSRRELDTARRDCEKYLKTDLRDSPARLYLKVDEETLSNDLVQFGGKRQTEIGGNVQSSLAENAKPDWRKTPNINRNAETTTEITTDIDNDAEIFTALENLTGELNTEAPRFVDIWKEKHTRDRILEAIAIAKQKGQRMPVSYVDAILMGWEANGYPKTREEQVNERRQVNGYNGKKSERKPDRNELSKRVMENAGRN